MQSNATGISLTFYYPTITTLKDFPE